MPPRPWSCLSPMPECPQALGAPLARGRIRELPDYFQVDELLGFEPGEGGEHLWLRIEKRGWNTMDVATWLAGQAGLPLRQVGFSGLKDRHARTWQWFSLHLPGKDDPDLSVLPTGLVLHQAVRHRRKLNRGTHRANRFVLRVTGLDADRGELERRLQAVAESGVPNYFGVQRFGRESRNVERAVAWLCHDGEAPRKAATRSMWLSALRSDLFNRVLAERVRLGCWNRLLDGDILQPEGSRGLFAAEAGDDSARRVELGEVNPTAPMPGVGGLHPGGASLALEQRALAGCEEQVAGLQRFGVEAARRATRLRVQDLRWTWLDAALALEFVLPAGAFATSVLAELINLEEVSHVAAGQ